MIEYEKIKIDKRDKKANVFFQSLANMALTLALKNHA
jgi:hypothetical protein